VTSHPPANAHAYTRGHVGTWILILSFVLLSACKESNRSTESAASQSALTSLPANQWLGVWTGPEGTSLELKDTEGRFRVTIHNLDGPRTFDAIATDSGATFNRDGVQETIRAGSGADTGMKWLADKSHCLVVKYGEGYCRE